MTHFINQSLQRVIIPDKMKLDKVVPLFKSSNQSLLKNNRPIILLSAFSKLLEKAMYNRLMTFSKINNIHLQTYVF